MHSYKKKSCEAFILLSYIKESLSRLLNKLKCEINTFKIEIKLSNGITLSNSVI